MNSSWTWTPRWIATVLGTPVPSSASELDTPFSEILTDSRKIKPGCLSVPLKGDQFDGHDFIESALAQGARGFIYERDRPVPSHPVTVFVFAVEDTQQAYRKISAAWRKQFKIPAVLVAGANGKTTTKEILTAILRGRYKHVLKTQGSQNGFVGIPMTPLELRPMHEAAVIEVGIDEPGAMAQHLQIVQPTAALVTIIGPEHMEKLRDLETVAREEALALTETAALGGSVSVNLDDPYLEPYFARLQGARMLGYSLRPGATNASILRGTFSADQKTLEVTGGSFERPEQFELPLPGKHNATNLLCAIATAQQLGLSAEEMRKGLQGFSGAEGRSQVRTLKDGTVVLCDYYNAQPASVSAGIELLGSLAHPPGAPARVQWACLADMLELGLDEERYHREVADSLLKQKVENILLYGQRMRWLADELRARGFQGVCRHFGNPADLARELCASARPGAAILIKGSRSMKMEEIWKALEKARS